MSTGGDSAEASATDAAGEPSHEQLTPPTWKRRPVGGAAPKGPSTTTPWKVTTPGDESEATPVDGPGEPGDASSCNWLPLSEAVERALVDEGEAGHEAHGRAHRQRLQLARHVHGHGGLRLRAQWASSCWSARSREGPWRATPSR